MLAFAYILHPQLALPPLLATFAYIRYRQRWRLTPDFLAGFGVGWLCLMLTAFLNALVLVIAGSEDWRHRRCSRSGGSYSGGLC